MPFAGEGIDDDACGMGATRSFSSSSSSSVGWITVSSRFVNVLVLMPASRMGRVSLTSVPRQSAGMPIMRNNRSMACGYNVLAASVGCSSCICLVE